MASGDISTTEAGDTYVSLLRVHLERFGILDYAKLSTEVNSVQVRFHTFSSNNFLYSANSCMC